MRHIKQRLKVLATQKFNSGLNQCPYTDMYMMYILVAIHYKLLFLYTYLEKHSRKPIL